MSVPNEGTARLFLALWPDPPVRQRLMQAAAEFRDDVAGRWTRPENLHLTLVFLGNVAADRWPDLVRIAATTPGSRFDLELDHGQFWPRNGIVCLAPRETPPALAELAGTLAARLRETGFPVERRPFRAHLTLARNGRSDRTRLPLAEPVPWPATEFCLVESRSGIRGPEYRVRECWPLGPVAADSAPASAAAGQQQAIHREDST